MGGRHADQASQLGNHDIEAQSGNSGLIAPQRRLDASALDESALTRLHSSLRIDGPGKVKPGWRRGGSGSGTVARR